MAAMNEPAETAFRVNTLRADPATVAAELRAAGVEVERARERAGCSSPARLPRRRDRRRAGGRPGRRPGSWSRSRAARRPWSRCSTRSRASGCSTCARGPGSRRPRSRRGWATAASSSRSRLDPRRAGRDRRSCAPAPASTCVRVEVADATEADLGSGYDRILLDPPCSDLGTLASRPDARWRKSPEDIERLAALQRRHAGSRRAGARPGRDARLLDLHDLGPRERGGRERARRVRGRRGAGRLSAPSIRGSPRARDARFLQLLPERDSTTGFFIARFRRRAADGRRAARSGRPSVPGAASRGCARPSSPGRYRCVYCLRRYELVSQLPELRRAPDDRPDVGRRGPALPALRPLDADQPV